VHYLNELWQMTAVLLDPTAEFQPQHSLMWYIVVTAALAAAPAGAAAA
jgi:hypothetical protein